MKARLVSGFLMFLVVSTVFVEVDSRKQYTGYSLLRIVPTTKEQLQYLLDLSEEENGDMEFWHLPSDILHPADLMVSSEKKEEVLRGIEQKGIPQSIIIQDVENIILQTKPLQEFIKSYSSDQFFTDFRRFHQINNYISVLASDNPEIATVLSIGNSTEGRSLNTVKIGKSNSNVEKPAIWIMGGIHAREWISPATATYFITQLIEGYGKNHELTQLVEDYDWYILPVTNPDGYEYSHAIDRLWRKTRSKTDSIWGCRGVDANRNFDVHWGEIGSSKQPCAQTYAGSRPASEPEVKAIQDLITSLKGRVKIFIDLHSYSQKLLTPYGWSRNFPPDYEYMKSAGESALKVLTAVHGTRYKLGTTSQSLYTVSGNSNDWAYDKFGVIYSFCFELRDTGLHGFLLPRAQIIPTAEETWAAVIELSKIARNKMQPL